MRRAIRINMTDGNFKDLELSKATCIKTEKEMINIEKLTDGTYRLIFSEGLINDFSKVVNFEMLRED